MKKDILLWFHKTRSYLLIYVDSYLALTYIFKITLTERLNVSFMNDFWYDSQTFANTYLYASFW